MTGIDTASWISRIFSGSAMRATPPSRISARPLFTRIVPISAIAPILATQAVANGLGLGGVGLGAPVDERVALEVEQRAQPAAGEPVRRGAPVALDHELRVVLRVPEEDPEGLPVARRAQHSRGGALRDEVGARLVEDDLRAALPEAVGGALERVVAGRLGPRRAAAGEVDEGKEREQGASGD